MNPRRLYRSRRDRQLAGVAAGMAEYLEVDPTLVRILWILSVFLGGFSILVYIILAFVIPLDPGTSPAPGTWYAGPAGAVPPAPSAGTEPPSEASGGAPDPGAGSVPGPAWSAPGPAWSAPDRQPDDGRGGRGALYVGIMLVVFGAIAMANVLLPGVAGSVPLGAAFLVALGVALLVGSTRRRAVGQ